LGRNAQDAPGRGDRARWPGPGPPARPARAAGDARARVERDARARAPAAGAQGDNRFKDAYLANGAVKFSEDLLASFSTPRPQPRAVPAEPLPPAW